MDRANHNSLSQKIRSLALTSLVIGGIVTGSITAAGSAELSHSEPAASAELQAGTVDMLNSQAEWDMAGAKKKGRELVITNTNLAIVHQDGSLGETEVPVNLYGTVLANHGAFKTTVELSNIHGSLEIDMDGQPPIIQDEFLALEDNLSMKIVGNTFSASVNDQKHGNGFQRMATHIPTGSKHTLEVTDAAGKLSFSMGGHKIGKTISDDGIFNTGRVYFGLDALSNGGTFNVNELTAQGQRKGTVGLVDTQNTKISISPNGFAALAAKKRRGFIVGTASELGPEVSDAKYDQILGNFNMITTEDSGKWQVTEPKQGQFNFADMDAQVALAEKAGQKIHGHTLVFGEANPEWVQEIAKNHPEQLEQVMINHIKAVMTHYKGKIFSWDVVNEIMSDYGTPAGVMGLRKNIWYDTMGPQYIVIALKAAREADPSAKLMINDFGTESDPSRLQEEITLIQWIKSQGGPIDAVGDEAHFDNNDTNSSDTDVSVSMLENDFATVYQETGIPSYISELDVSNTPQEYPVFGDTYTACIESPYCDGVTIWGPTDKYGSGADIGSNGKIERYTGRPWDVNENPTPAVNYIRQALTSAVITNRGDTSSNTAMEAEDREKAGV